MIKITNNIDDIVPLWKEAFGDSREDIVFFIDNIRNGVCLAEYQNDKAVSMLYLVDCSLNSKQAHYIYAACTDNKYQKNGYMAGLIKYCIDNYDRICLIPANEHLVDYYNKQGLVYKHPVEDLKFNECRELIDEYLYAGCSLDSPVVLVNRQ